MSLDDRIKKDTATDLIYICCFWVKKLEASYRDIWKLAAPIIGGSLAQTALNITDTAFLGRVGETELGAAALASVYYLVLVMMGIAIGTGAQILIARREGEGHPQAIGQIFDHTFIIQSATAVVLWILLYGFTPWLFAWVIDRKEVLQAALDYIEYRGWAILPALVAGGCRGFFIGIARTEAITVASLLMLIVNALLDYLLIFGKAGLPAMGIAGAGLASGLAELIAAAYLLSRALSKKQFSIYRLFAFTAISFRQIKHIVELAFPILMQNLISMGAWFLFFALIENMGSRELAVSNIVRATYMILMTPMWGFSSAANSMTSNLIGQGKSYQLFLLLRRIIAMSLGMSLIVGVPFALFPNVVLRLVTDDISLIDASHGTYYVTCGALLVFSISLILFSAVAGTGNTRIALWIETFNILVYLIYVYACVHVWKTSLEWVWGSEILYWLLMGILSYAYLRSGHWKKIRI